MPILISKKSIIFRITTRKILHNRKYSPYHRKRAGATRIFYSYFIYKNQQPHHPIKAKKIVKRIKISVLLFVQKKQNKYICTRKREDRLRLAQQEINLLCLKGLRYLRRNNSAPKFALKKVYFLPINTI